MLKVYIFLSGEEEGHSQEWRPLAGYFGNRPIFTPPQEEALVSYIKTSSDIYFGLTPLEVRRLAYLCAKKFGIQMPQKWVENEQAGPDWFSGFLKRNNTLAIRTPEATSLARASSFNKVNVNKFFDKLEELYNRYSFGASDIYNTDETGITSVQKPVKRVARKGVKQVGAMTSAERGELVTLCTAVNAAGNAIPPMLIFPRVRYQEHFVRDGPVGCVGAGNHSGWMSETEFLMFMKHFVNCVRPSKDNPILLLLDNHQSHLSPSVLDFAKSNGVVMLSFPPHCTHRLQPLDRSVYGPLKKHVNTAMDSWICNNKAQRLSDDNVEIQSSVRRITIYDIPGIVKVAYPLAMTQRNIQNGFQKCGIFPFNRNVFEDADFGPSFFTDRPNPIVTEIETETNSTAASSAIPNGNRLETPEETTNQPSTSTINVDLPEIRVTSKQSLPPPVVHAPSTPSPSTSSKMCVNEDFSPEIVLPLPKAGFRKCKRGKGFRKSAILTDTPEKEALEKEYKQRKRGPKPKGKELKAAKVKGMQKKNVRKSLKFDYSSEEEDDENTVCLVCIEPFSKSKPGEEWVQCLECKRWSHFSCAKKSKTYVCHHCESDEFSEED